MALPAISSLDTTPLGTPVPPKPEPQTEGGFAKLIDQLLSHAADSNVKADQAVMDLALGRTDNLHHVMLSVARADLSFRTILEIRNRLTEAFQEIMRMQV
jgi:flagellar hook-basal body complex protein FliE